MNASLMGLPIMEHHFDVTVRFDAGCLLADVTGRIDTVEALAALFIRLAAELRQTGMKRLLVLDHTFGVVPSENELGRLFAAVDGLGLQSVRLAYVDARGTAVGRMEIAELMGRERGYECRIFDNEQLAKIWLSYGEN